MKKKSKIDRHGQFYNESMAMVKVNPTARNDCRETFQCSSQNCDNYTENRD